MGDKRYDVVIVGAGPAGSTAAILLARKGRSVALLDRDTQSPSVPCAGWLSAKAVPLLEELGCKFPEDCVTPFSQVDFYNADCTKHATPRFDRPVGFLVRRTQFDEILRTHAASLGVALIRGYEAKDIRLNESHVVVKSDKEQTLGRLLILATGRSPDLPSKIGFRPRASDAPAWVSQVEAPQTSRGAGAEPRVTVILGLDQKGDSDADTDGIGEYVSAFLAATLT